MITFLMKMVQYQERNSWGKYIWPEGLDSCEGRGWADSQWNKEERSVIWQEQRQGEDLVEIGWHACSLQYCKDNWRHGPWY